MEYGDIYIQIGKLVERMDHREKEWLDIIDTIRNILKNLEKRVETLEESYEETDIPTISESELENGSSLEFGSRPLLTGEEHIQIAGQVQKLIETIDSQDVLLSKDVARAKEGLERAIRIHNLLEFSHTAQKLNELQKSHERGSSIGYQ